MKAVDYAMKPFSQDHQNGDTNGAHLGNGG